MDGVGRILHGIIETLLVAFIVWVVLGTVAVLYYRWVL